MMGRFKIFFIFVLIFHYSLYSQTIQYNEDAEKNFASAIEEYKSGNFQKSKFLFENLTIQGNHQRITASWIMLSKCYLQLKKYKQSIEVIQKFIQQFPKSTYLDDAYYILGYARYREGEYISAFNSFLDAINLTENKRILNNSISVLENISIDIISVEDLFTIIKKVEDRDLVDLVKTLYSLKLFRAGSVLKARDEMKKIISRPLTPKYRGYIENIWSKVLGKLEINIGVLVPLMRNYSSSIFSELGEDLFSGMSLCVDEYNNEEDNYFKIVLDVRDTERIPSKATSLLEDMIEEKNLLCIVGPIFSTEVSACAEVAQRHKIPLITPTATGSGIAEIGDYIFQANSNYINRGRSLARLAVEKLGLINLAVLSPEDPNSKSVTESFVKEAEKLGANIVRIEWYDDNNDDFSKQFLNFRAAATNLEPVITFTNSKNYSSRLKIIKTGVDSRLLDSLIEYKSIIGVNRLFGKHGKKIADSLGLIYYYPHTTGDTSMFEISSIHGLLIPVSTPDKIGAITSQLKYFNINTQILGTSEWYNEIELQKNSSYVNNVIFISEFFIDENALDVREFIKKYYRKYGKNPTRNSYYGYDVMKLIISQIENGGTNSNLLQRLLSRVNKFQTLHSKITLSSGRVNNEFHILKFINGKILKVGEISY